MRRAMLFALGLVTIPAGSASAYDRAPAAFIGRNPSNCVGIVNAAALRAVSGTSAFGQMSVWGDPVVMGADHLRIDVDAFNAQYAVDVIIGKGCRVLSVSTNLETNPSP